ncbi:MAG: hypothetical protein LIO77_04270 [Rikenellaceae bacterium]|nr:hypothetical protein [Rikenellaceae bacterium]
MHKLYLLILLALSVSCTPKSQFTAQLNIGDGLHPAEDITETIEVLRRRLQYSGAESVSMTRDGSRITLRFHSPLDEDRIGTLLTTPGRYSISEVYTRGELGRLRQAWEDFYREESYSDPYGEQFFESVYPGWHDPYSSTYVIGVIPSENVERAAALLDKPFWEGLIPADARLLITPANGGQPFFELVAVKYSGENWTEYIENAKVITEYGMSEIAILFNTKGKERFAEMTGENVDNFLAIEIDDRLLLVPRVNSQITGGRTSITGFSEKDEARYMAAIIKGGTLPLPVELTLLGEGE